MVAQYNRIKMAVVEYNRIVVEVVVVEYNRIEVAAQYNRTRPRCGLNPTLAHGYSQCPTALLLVFLSLCERSDRET